MNGLFALGPGAGLLWLLAGCASDGAAVAAKDGGTVHCETDFARLSSARRVSLHDDVMPILGLSCAMRSCHGGDAPAAKFYLGVRCNYDANSEHHCTFPDAPDPTSSNPEAMPLTAEVVDRVYQGLLAASNTAPALQRVAPGDPGASFLVDKVGGTQGDRGYDCIPMGSADLSGPCGSPMPFGTSMCDLGSSGVSQFETITAWVLQGAHED